MKVAAQCHSDEAAGTPLLASKLVAPRCRVAWSSGPGCSSCSTAASTDR
jgi:hypothetical protein